MTKCGHASPFRWRRGFRRTCSAKGCCASRDEIAQDPVLSQRLALKGGTALNVFYLYLVFDSLCGYAEAQI